MAGEDMCPTCPGHSFPFLSIESATEFLYSKHPEKKVGV
jgi:hypothetical protein